MEINKEKYYLTVIDKDGLKRKLSLIEVERLFNMTWVEWDEDSLNQLENLEIRYSGAEVGWGMFAKRKIKKGTLITVFTGEVRFQSRNNPILSESIFIKDAPDNQYQIVDGSRFGNIARFMQHLPPKEILSNIRLMQTSPEDIAVENVEKILYEFKPNLYTEKYIALTDIEPHTIIGCCYNQRFWLEKTPVLFKKNGTIILSQEYLYIDSDDKLALRNYKIPTYHHSSTKTLIKYGIFALTGGAFLYGLYQIGFFNLIHNAFNNNCSEINKFNRIGL